MRTRDGDHGVTLEFCHPQGLRLLPPYPALLQANPWEETASSTPGCLCPSGRWTRIPNPLIINNGVGSGVDTPMGRLLASQRLVPFRPNWQEPTSLKLWFQLSKSGVIRCSQVAGGERARNLASLSAAASPASTPLLSVFAFLSDLLADIIKMSIHSFNKYL